MNCSRRPRFHKNPAIISPALGTRCSSKCRTRKKMGQVIPWKNKSARQEVIELARAVLAQAECGDLKSLFVVGETASQGVQGAAAGGFADDPTRGARIASKALQAML